MVDSCLNGSLCHGNLLGDLRPINLSHLQRVVEKIKEKKNVVRNFESPLGRKTESK